MAKNLDRSNEVLRIYRVDRDSKEFGLMDWAICWEVSRTNLENSIEEACIERYQEAMKDVSGCYRDAWN